MTNRCMPTPPKVVGREFVRHYYTIMSKSPENFHNFFTESASFIHDDIDSTERRTINADSKMAIREIMQERIAKFKHTSTKVHLVDVLETLDDGLIVRITGEISFNEQPMRPFSQTIILIPHTPFQYFVQNDIFRFSDFDSTDDQDCTKTHTNSVSSESMPTDANWGTQCEEYVAPPDDEQAKSKKEKPRVDSVGDENEVKLDTSDSGMSSDAEKAIMDIQSINLKNMLQESRSISKESVMKRGPTSPVFVESEPIDLEEKSAADGDISQNHNELFRDSCILTIGNVVNPNIEFDDATTAEVATSQNGNDTSSKTDESSSSGKSRYRKRKDKRKARESKKDESAEAESTKMESTEMESTKTESTKPIEEPSKEPEANEQSIEKKENISEKSPRDKTEDAPKMPIVSSSPIKEKTPDQDKPKAAPEIKTYADLAKSGGDEWVDELKIRRDSIPKPTTERSKPRPSMTIRRSSRADRPSPNGNGNGNDASYSSRSSPRNDYLQVFVGNIPHGATDEGIKKMFSCFGRITRFRLHANNRKEWLPLYAFITYDNLQSAKQCLSRKHTFYWPDSSGERQKLNVNGDPSVDIWDDYGNVKPNETQNIKTQELKKFSRNFVLDNKEQDNKRSPDADTNISIRNERRKLSTRS